MEKRNAWWNLKQLTRPTDRKLYTAKNVTSKKCINTYNSAIADL